MQLVMNQVDTYTTTTKGNNLFDVLKTVVKKITTAFAPAKKSKFSNASVVEAIEYIEWRTKYDQRRIIQYVNVLTALAQSPKLCSSLDIKEPTYTSKWLKDDRHNIQSRTRELLSRDYPKNNTASVRVVDDNRFDILLSKFTGHLELDPRTQALISGKGVANAAVHRSLRKRLEDISTYNGDNADILSLQYNMLEAEKLRSTRSQEQAVEELQQEYILNEMSFILDAVEAAMKEVQNEAKVTPVAEQPTEVEPVTIKSETKPDSIKKVIKDLNKLTIPKLKAFAKERGFKLSGRTTQISAIRASIVRQLKESSPQ